MQGIWRIVVLGLILAQARAAEGVSLAHALTWQHAFGGGEITQTIQATNAGEAWQGRLTLRVFHGDAPLAQQQDVLRLAAHASQTLSHTFALPLPEEGKVAKLRVEYSALDAQGRAAATLSHPLFVHSRALPAGHQRLLARARIHLFDPPGATRALFDRVGIPYEAVHNPDALAELSGGTVILGEGLSFRKYRGLAAIIAELPRKGVPVLCLAPAEGELPIGPLDDAAAFAGLELARAAALPASFGDVDRLRWGPELLPLASSFDLEGERGTILARLRPDGDGWAWLSLRAPGGACLALSGFKLGEAWDLSPNASLLFFQQLEHVLPPTPATP